MTTAPVATDEELAARVGGGDSAAFGELYERYFEGAYDFTMRIVRDSDVAADVVQGAFTRAWETLQTDEPPRKFKAWLYTVARNRAIDQIRDRKRTVSLIEGDRDDEDGRPVTPQAALIDSDRLGNPVDAVRDTEVAELVWAAASSLSPDEYSLLDMHLRRQLTPEEMAAELEVKSGTLYTRLSRLRDSVEDSLAAELLRRRGREDCPDLDALLVELEDGEIDRTARRRILRHTDKCDICSENRRRFVTAAELLPALVPIPAAPGLQSELWRALEIPDAAPLAGGSSGGSSSGGSSTSGGTGGSGGGISVGGATVPVPVAIAGAVAAVVTIVAAVTLFAGDSSSDEPERVQAPTAVGAGVAAGAPPTTAATVASTATPAATGAITVAFAADSLDATPPFPGQVLVFKYEDVFYLPVGAVEAAAHVPNCSYAHIHGPPMQSLEPDGNGDYLELSEPLGECGFGAPEGNLFFVPAPD